MKPEPTLLDALEALRDKPPAQPPTLLFYNNFATVARGTEAAFRSWIYDLVPENHKGTRKIIGHSGSWPFRTITQEALDILHVHADKLNEIGKVFSSDHKHNKHNKQQAP